MGRSLLILHFSQAIFLTLKIFYYDLLRKLSYGRLISCCRFFFFLTHLGSIWILKSHDFSHLSHLFKMYFIFFSDWGIQLTFCLLKKNLGEEGGHKPRSFCKCTHHICLCFKLSSACVYYIYFYSWQGKYEF